MNVAICDAIVDARDGQLCKRIPVLFADFWKYFAKGSRFFIRPSSRTRVNDPVRLVLTEFNAGEALLRFPPLIGTVARRIETTIAVLDTQIVTQAIPLLPIRRVAYPTGLQTRHCISQCCKEKAKCDCEITLSNLHVSLGWQVPSCNVVAGWARPRSLPWARTRADRLMQAIRKIGT